ncbi:hypothetical protein PTT_16828 [Pyrenophora teres f. teres 0-1]|uniref:ubiquitinyl hydrolase 1 n=2 Tax=Pyrenophora teres f. teres TaxID=97479 RepID=E3S340_PYRTT|nr:hypothetical protein PTT_16828 [Pyrenophora teres f. teres 0-1]KAE8850521.1 hypothetical protein PTNB85_00937 [Pyrenophora teres f. teres]KAE8870117.1 hypothetical protein PTNB29_00461 [Pyrenophora teres f. teres]CAE7010177.1 DUF3645 multi-domain protein [Pyrenophora teres f. teres]
MGQRESIEFASERWLTIQDVLGLLPEYALQVKNEAPQSIGIQKNAEGQFTQVRFLQSDAADRVLDLLATHAVEFGIGIPSRSQPPGMKTAILHYISQKDFETDQISVVEESPFWTETTKASLLLLRGLFAGGVLRYIFGQKRYRVSFGFDRPRTPGTLLAVPYKSNDSPSPQSEISHPDVVIILNLLSWYYSGLGDEGLIDVLSHVLRSDQATIHYDDFCNTQLFPGLRYSRKVVDYFLSYLVFPKQLKQFPKKLSASGWDLAVQKAHPTTGFSGTNDTRHMLPLSIEQLDLPTQHHTNAQVLSYLLMDETLVENLPARAIESGSDGEHLLSFIHTLNQGIRTSRGDEAVVYFEDEELSVLDRNSRIEPLQTSPYSRMLESCIIYLDESHTRGTDLRLPQDYRAALTLGSQVTIDRVTQAAMRMRKLGNGQTVTFIVPEEIRTKTFETTSKKPGVSIEVYDVLAWAIGEACSDFQISTVHQDLSELVEIGNILPVSDAWQPAFQALRTTRAVALINLNDFPKDLLVTRDFMNTVLVPSGTSRANFTTDHFQRAVQFVISVPDPGNSDTISNLMIISPYEANSLMTKIRLDAKVTLHVFAARANISFASLDNLTLYTVGHEYTPGSVSPYPAA